MTPLQYGLLTFVFGLTFFTAVWLLLRWAREPEPLPSLPEVLARITASPGVVVPWPPSKEEASCCQAHALPDGRPVIGYCGPDCERRPS